MPQLHIRRTGLAQRQIERQSPPCRVSVKSSAPATSSANSRSRSQPQAMTRQKGVSDVVERDPGAIALAGNERRRSHGCRDESVWKSVKVTRAEAPSGQTSQSRRRCRDRFVDAGGKIENRRTQNLKPLRQHRAVETE